MELLLCKLGRLEKFAPHAGAVALGFLSRHVSPVYVPNRLPAFPEGFNGSGRGRGGGARRGI
jgi:hypothetical protein